jgi:eukaryotic-like serine/threonine-protein kinase
MGVAQLGRYTILKHLASGGMADVLLGRAEGIEGFERHVVVKRIKPELAKDRRFIEMFLDEARLAATLHHQNVVQVYDIGEDAGEYFFAMEYLHGEDLRKLLGAVAKQKQHIPLAHVVAIVSAAAAGLHYAHERRAADKKKLEIVHRDVTPSNIFIGYDGSVKLVDFGIAKATMSSSDTRTGTLKGKTSYMSPEQCKGEATIDRRSDIYSLGVVLYELATTTRLFKGESEYLIMDAIVNGKVPLPRVRRPDLPNELAQIIMRALSVDRNRRFETADQMRQALDQFAVDANLPTSSMASYMKKMFGEKAEPWLDSGSVLAPRTSWADMGSHNEFGIHDQPTRAGDETYPSFASEARAAVSSPTLSSSSSLHRITSGTGESRTHTPVAWEQRAQLPTKPQDFGRHKKALLIAAPIAVALVGVGIWHRGGKPPQVTSAVAANEPVQSAPIVAPPATRSATVAKAEAATPPPPPIVTPDANVGAATEPKPLPRPATARLSNAAPPRPTMRSKPAVVAIEQPATPPVAKESKAELSAPAPAPAPVVTPPPAVPAPAAAPAAAPMVVEPTMMVLSPATVSLVARDHAGQLAKCEGSNTLHGDLAITFEINGAGKVVRSQMSSMIKNVKVAGCILGAVRSWQYPKPPSGSAKGVYSITYQ